MNSYYQYIEITDFGPYITKLILALQDTVQETNIAANSFCVYTEVRDWEGNQVMVPENFLARGKFVPSKGYRKIREAYPSDRMGNRQPSGRFVTLEMAYGPSEPCSSALSADFSDPCCHEYYTDNMYVITQTREIQAEHGVLSGLVFQHCAKVMNPAVDRWLEDVSSDPEQPLRYGYYVPRMGQGKRPLIVWLHGAGEGGEDTAISYSGNKVTALSDAPIQKKFGGAFVFSPQCSTMWMDDGSHVIGDSGKSIYTRALKAAIDEFVERFAWGIDVNRIYIGGDSNGGFMTMRMILDFPNFFAAAFPICEALLDERIPDAGIKMLRDFPIWFTHAKDDTLVPPDRYVVPTYQRLIAEGAKNVHFTFWDGIYDMHGLFRDSEGKPWRYFGHFAWIPVFNDDCRLDYDGKPVKQDGVELTLFDWLALQSRS